MIEKLAELVLKFLWDAGQYLLAAFMVIVILRMGWYWSLRNPSTFPDSRKEAKQAIREERWGQRYADALKWLNARLAGWIGDAARFSDAHAGTLRQHLTVESYEFCLKLAFLYPILAFVVAWAMGGDGRLGELPVWQRWLSLTALLVAFGLAVWSRYLSGRKFWLAVAVVVAVAFAGAGAGAVAFAVAGTLVVAFAFAFAGAVAVAVAGTLVVANVGGFIITWSYKKSSERDQRWLFWLFYSLLFGLLALVVLNFTDNVITQLILLFYFLFPLLNAPIDWLSLGFTRYLLYRLESERGWSHVLIWGLVDLVLALFFLALISLVLVSALVLTNSIAVTPVVDLTRVFAGLRDDNPVNEIWIYFILLSTLIPTLVHFALVGGALTRAIPQSWRDKMADRMDRHAGYNNHAWLYISIMPAFGYVLAPGLLLSLLYFIVTTHGGTIGFFVLDAAEGWAKLLTHGA